MDSKSICPVTIADQTFSLVALLQAVHRRGLLQSLLAEVAIEERAVAQARQAGLAVSDAELQQAANRFRQQHGLADADAAHGWLARQGWSVNDFESRLERELLIERFKDELCSRDEASHFNAHRPAYDEARLRMILVTDEGLARELLSQSVAEERAFADLAREQSLHPSCTRGGQMGWARRGELPAEVAAAVFAASPGSCLGPLAVPDGLALFMVEELRPAELNDATRHLIRKHVYDLWVAEQLTTLHVDLSWLKDQSAGDGRPDA